MSHGHGTSGSICCCLRGEFTIPLKICRPEEVGLDAFRASRTEGVSLIGGEELGLELIIKTFHENCAVRKETGHRISGFKEAAVGSPLTNQ